MNGETMSSSDELTKASDLACMSVARVRDYLEGLPGLSRDTVEQVMELVYADESSHRRHERALIAAHPETRGIVEERAKAIYAALYSDVAVKNPTWEDLAEVHRARFRRAVTVAVVDHWAEYRATGEAT